MNSEHLPPELLFGYQHRLLLPEELRAVHDHVAGCEACRNQLAEVLNADQMARDVRSSIALARKPARRFYSYLAAAAAIVLAVGASIWVWRLSIRPSAEARGGDDAPSVQAALRTGRIPLPGFLDQLAPPRETLMGGAPAASSRLLSPKATAVLGPSVRFQWEPLPGEWVYQVRIFQLSGELVLTSSEITASEWTVTQGLSPGADYQWQITATRGAERVTLPEPPETAPRFRVLDARVADRLQKLARLHPEAHLFLGVEYGQAGAVEDARVELTRAIQQGSQAAAARKLLESLISPR